MSAKTKIVLSMNYINRVVAEKVKWKQCDGCEHIDDNEKYDGIPCYSCAFGSKWTPVINNKN